MNFKSLINKAGVAAICTSIVACAAGPDKPGFEYAPQMYHSTPYEPLTQITDEDAGTWLDSNPEDNHGEFYNSNPYNPYRMTVRKPVANTVRRGEPLPYRYQSDELEAAAAVESPFSKDQEVIISKGKELYNSYCKHCHGEKGNADGKVAEKYPGVANLNGAAYKEITEGHIFHVITYGKGLMGAHGSQVSPEDRWKIAKYVKELQKNQ
ncbi:MAG: cytochrome c [Bacteroidota bacterium]